MEILQSVSTILRFPAVGDDEVAFGSTPVVTITRDSDGSKVKEEAATTEVPAGEVDIKHYTIALTGKDLPEVELLTCVWSDGTTSYTTQVEVVGAYVVSLKAVEAKLAEAATTAELEAKREAATKDIEAACGVAFRPRYAKERLNGGGSKRLILRKQPVLRIIAVEVDEAELSEAEVKELTIDPLGILIRPTWWPAGRGNILVTYVQGYEGGFTPAIEPVRDYAAYLLTPAPTDWQGRATSVTNEYGSSFALVTPGVRGASFPLPSVNAFVERFETPLIA